ncbi:hypothetical protein L6452_13320 [Arctium lappa]|uniref:Uncharacterized protein n=1 Tax=Arctium lappa TaxID=4217 RepID=A0ACB9CHT2_ARCLA|nr:hypothetical protein L6452_13320 [Arctium lappa]
MVSSNPSPLLENTVLDKRFLERLSLRSTFSSTSSDHSYINDDGLVYKRLKRLRHRRIPLPKRGIVRNERRRYFKQSFPSPLHVSSHMFLQLSEEQN